jgi:hypothetical protein
LTVAALLYKQDQTMTTVIDIQPQWFPDVVLTGFETRSINLGQWFGQY